MNAVIIGSGVSGLTDGAYLARAGHRVSVSSLQLAAIETASAIMERGRIKPENHHN